MRLILMLIAFNISVFAMECLPVLNIPSFDCFFSIFIYFTLFLMGIFGAGKLLRG